MKQLLSITKKDAVAVAAGFGKIGAAALSNAVASKALKVTVDSFVNTVTHIRNTVRNSY